MRELLFQCFSDTKSASIKVRGNRPLLRTFLILKILFTTFCHPKGGAKMCAVTNFRVRRLPSVKRTPARFYFVKSYPFFNPPSALRPFSEKFAGRGWADARISIIFILFLLLVGAIDKVHNIHLAALGNSLGEYRAEAHHLDDSLLLG